MAEACLFLGGFLVHLFRSANEAPKVEGMAMQPVTATEDEKVVIIDCGSQYTQLIARRIRDLGVYSEILPWDVAEEKIFSKKPKGIVISGGPGTALDPDAPVVSRDLLDGTVPVLGICYGMQLAGYLLGKSVKKGNFTEYGKATVVVERTETPLFKGLPGELTVWMSHWDYVETPPQGFHVTARSRSGMIAGFSDESGRIQAIQFHPEVSHTDFGVEILKNFLFGICGCSGTWNLSDWTDAAIRAIREKVGDDRVVCGLSGGVDSTVAAVLTQRAVGDNLECIFVDTGLLRQDEASEVQETYRKNLKLKVHFVDASEVFLKALSRVFDPEKNYFKISKISVPEDAYEFYNPIIQWLKEYAQSPLPKTVIDFDLEYVNSASAKQIIQLLLALEDINKNNKVVIKWYYEAIDEDMQLLGKRFKNLADIEFEFVEI